MKKTKLPSAEVLTYMDSGGRWPAANKVFANASKTKQISCRECSKK